jgi:hypothetical protein
VNASRRLSPCPICLPALPSRVTVDGMVTHPIAAPERGVIVSHYTALQLSGHCHRYRRTMNEIVAMSVQEREIVVIIMVMITISVMNLQHVRCAQT